MKNRSLPPLGWFRAFESAARLLSFTAAAEELGLTQSAVSQQIRGLEDRFGCALFVRKHRSIALTDDGRRLLPGVANGIANLREASEAFEPATDPQILTVATSVSVAQWFLTPLLKHFIERYGDVKIRIVTAVWPDELIASTADVRIRYCPIDAASKNSEPLGSNQIGLFAPSSINNMGKTQTHLTSIAESNLIQPVGTADTWTRYSSYAGLSIEKPVSVYVDSHGIAVDLAQSGTGIAITSALISAPSVIQGKLQLLHPVLMPAKDGYFIETASNDVNNIAHQFVFWLKQETLQAEAIAYKLA